MNALRQTRGQLRKLSLYVNLVTSIGMWRYFQLGLFWTKSPSLSLIMCLFNCVFYSFPNPSACPNFTFTHHLISFIWSSLSSSSFFRCVSRIKARVIGWETRVKAGSQTRLNKLIKSVFTALPACLFVYRQSSWNYTYTKDSSDLASSAWRSVLMSPTRSDVSSTRG